MVTSMTIVLMTEAVSASAFVSSGPLSQSQLQPTTSLPRFEVASIKLADPDKFTPPNFALNFQDSFPPDPNPHGRLIAQFPLEIYIYFAYKLPIWTLFKISLD